MIYRIYLNILVGSLFFVSLLVQADNINFDADGSIPGVRTLSAETLIELAQVLDDLIIIDSRITEDRSIGFIEDSISLSDTNTSCSSLKKVGANKRKPVVFYCNGTMCGQSVAAVNTARDCGYKNLFWFRGGFEEWRMKDYPYLLD